MTNTFSDTFLQKGLHCSSSQWPLLRDFIKVITNLEIVPYVGWAGDPWSVLAEAWP